MSLEGNLTAFGLSEILQLIAVQKKSGMLTISNEDRSRALFFRDGHIMSTRDRRRKAKDPLRDYLTRYGILTREDLMRLVDISAQSKIDLTDVIVSEGFLSEEEMLKHFRNHIQESVHEILTWEQCSYKFIPGDNLIDGIKSWGDFNIEGILMESMRRIDEFPQMLKELPNLSSRISLVKEPAEKNQLTSNEATIVGLLDEEKTLGRLIAGAKIPKFETYEALKHLNEKDLIEICVEGEDDDGPIRDHTSKKRRRRKRKNVVPVLCSILIFSMAMYWGARNLTPYVNSYLTNNSDVAVQNSLSRSQAEDRLRWMLEAYRAKHGVYPTRLESLKRSGVASASFIQEVDRYSFRYHLTAGVDHYTLL